MLRSLFSAISGLRSHQVYLDIIGNNIANVNTTSFKANRASFAETLWQTTRTGGAPQANVGGTNPLQVGLGTNLVGSDAIFTQGDLRSTGKASDLALEGNGFFVLSDGSRQMYSRDGSFDVGIDGFLQSTTTGLRVLGWMADPVTGEIDTTRALSNISIPVGGGTPALPTQNVAFNGNLDARAANGDTISTTVDVFDSLGTAHSVELTFTKTGANAWSWAAAVNDDPAVAPTAVGSGTVSFNTDGSYSAATGSISIGYTAASGATTPQAVAIDLAQLTQFGETAGVDPFSRDGHAAGRFVSFATDSAGVVTAIYSNGELMPVAQLALADFKNQAGLMRAGNNLYEVSANSGDPLIGPSGTQGLGKIRSSYLEMSNVDLAQQFTNMIVASRGFQANSRVITTADEMLQELVNLKR